MKLWQKIFLLTLTLVIIVVNASSLALLSNNHSLAIEREQLNALTRHNYLDIELRNNIINTQLNERKLSLTQEETLAVVTNVLAQQGSGIGIALFQEREPIISSNGGDTASTVDLLSQPDFSSIIEDHGDQTLLYLVSSVTLSGQTYQLVTRYDITATYVLFRADFNQVRFIGIISALIIAGMLLLLVRGLLRPLRNLSATTSLIARGDLEKRAKVKGHDEVAEVAQSLNTMADSIESNVTALEELAESRRVFISNLAHEMKTPLTSILGFADILRVKREVSDDERIEYANIIVSETKRLQELSGKLMELLSLGRLQLAPQYVDVSDFVDDLVKVLAPIVNSHSLELKVELPAEAVFIRIDEELMKSFVFNLVDNSIKASSPASTIRLIVEVLPSNSEQSESPDELLLPTGTTGTTGTEGGGSQPAESGELGESGELRELGELGESGKPREPLDLGEPLELLEPREPVPANLGTIQEEEGTEYSKALQGLGETSELVKITVVDEGIGIPADEIPLIVEPFYMLDKARTRKHGGAGLGLALCAEIARAHNSRLEIRSIEGRGTAISVQLKRERNHA